MKIRYCIFLLGSMLGISHAKAQHKGRHVILVTIDGFRPDFYMETKWSTPTLKSMKEQGYYADGVNSVFPSITYPSHTTIVTGVQPIKHGIYYNDMFDEGKRGGKIYWKFDQVKSPTIWQVAKAQGLTAASLMWPASAGVPNDFNLSDVGSMGADSMRKYSYPEGIFERVQQSVFNGQKISLGKDQNVAKIAAWEILNNRPNVMTIHLFSVDHAAHTVGRDGKMVEDAISDADSSVQIIQKAIMDAGIQDSTLLIVTGDHGFCNVAYSLQPNAILAKAGLLNPENPADWKARFHIVGGSAFLFVRNNDQTIINQVKTLFQNLPKEEKQYFRIVSRKEMNAIGADPNAVLALSGLNDAAFGNSTKGDFVQKGKGGTHGFFPDFKQIQTGFLMSYPGQTKSKEIKSMNLRDITAIMVDYLGLKMPSMEGNKPF